MIKNILVSIGDTDYERNAFDYAGQLAVLLGTHLSCVFFQDSSHGGSAEVAETVLRRTEKECSLYDFLDYHIEAVAGNPRQMICQKAHSADLVVVGLPEDIKTRGLKLIQNQIDDVLAHITKPIIVVHEQCTLLRKILVVNHGDIYSDHVLSLSAEIGELTKSEILGLALSNTAQEATEIKQQMEAYLEFYDVTTEFLTALGFTVTNILENAEANDCDLIALSASHHGRLYEMVFQSTTQTVVKLANRAVLVTK
ncbi:MAG: universal stress protein [Candidatus Poribacteria bacterium]|nr:universal stress protein [Candidatus Poribacteria bacterium]